jgi:hypothetical protein
MPYCTKMHFLLICFLNIVRIETVSEKEVEGNQDTSSFFKYVGWAASWARDILVMLRGPRSRNCMSTMKAKFHCRVNITPLLVPHYETQPQNTLQFYFFKTNSNPIYHQAQR